MKKIHEKVTEFDYFKFLDNISRCIGVTWFEQCINFRNT